MSKLSHRAIYSDFISNPESNKIAFITDNSKFRYLIAKPILDTYLIEDIIITIDGKIGMVTGIQELKNYQINTGFLDYNDKYLIFRKKHQIVGKIVATDNPKIFFWEHIVDKITTKNPVLNNIIHILTDPLLNKIMDECNELAEKNPGSICIPDGKINNTFKFICLQCFTHEMMTPCKTKCINNHTTIFKMNI